MNETTKKPRMIKTLASKYIIEENETNSSTTEQIKRNGDATMQHPR